MEGDLTVMGTRWRLIKRYAHYQQLAAAAAAASEPRSESVRREARGSAEFVL